MQYSFCYKRKFFILQAAIMHSDPNKKNDKGASKKPEKLSNISM